MAKMFPEKPYEIIQYSKEDIMFKAFETLSEDYMVFHSFNIVSIKDGNIEESETDFVVFHPNKGIICIEAKAGKNIKYEKNSWFYGSGIEMKHGGPFNQAQNNKYKLIRTFKDHYMDDIVNRCKFIHAVWFPDITIDNLNQMKFPLEADKNLVLTQEALSNPEAYINKIFNINIHDIETNLSEKDVNRILKNILCPSFNLASTKYSDLQYKNIVYRRLIKEQINVLNYLEEQQTAIINGAAGTGKTFIALEKARREAEKNEKVLFLCYNRMLNKYLKENYQHQNIDFYTIDEYACKTCKTAKTDYNRLSEILCDYLDMNDFPYQHIIIDEGQDFGKNNIEESNIIEYLQAIINNSEKGSFYIFYDRNQMINSYNIPSYLKDADCKLTLYKNCRNTRNIATTSTRVLGDKFKTNIYFDFLTPSKPKLYLTNGNISPIETLNLTINQLKENYKDIVILTCTTEEKSFLNSYLVNNKYQNILFTTCRKFKGLEADAVILIDVNKNTFISEPLIFYAGSSRAKFDLSIIGSLSGDDCAKVLESLNTPPTNKNIFKIFASKFNLEIIN